MAGAELSPEIDMLVYTYGLQVLNDEDSWNYVWQRYLEESDPDEALNLQYALTTVRNATLLERLVEYAKNESLIRKHHYFSLLRNIAGNPKGFPLVTQLIYNNWTEIVKRHGIHKAEVFASAVFSRYETERDLGKVRQFYRKHKKTKDAEISRTHAIENILENIRWHKKHKDSIKIWMAKNTYMPWNRIRLPRHIIPNHYNLKLMPDITHSTFRGEVEIEVNVTKETDYMLIHESSLKIQRTELRNMEFNESISIDEAYPFRRNHFWVIRFSEALSMGVYVLKMIFSGKFVHDGNGMTRYHYIHRETKEKRYLIATQFEPTDARKVFPCFDEPDMKAKFKLTIVHDGKYTSVSNMPEEARNNLNDSLVETIFSESVPMSTYLVCCVVCDFEYLEAEYRGKKIRAYAPSDRIQEAEHGLNMTVKILEKYEEYFNVDYVLPKLDSVAIPNFTVPAMEHWGVITYNTRSFLVDETVSAFKRMADIDRVIAHELAHQWFGNLVTMKWWNDLWLNEGVSTLIMYIPLKEYHPAIGELDVRKVSKMMCSDSSLDSHPILHNVSNPGEISDLFDTISYEKGSAVLKMLQYTLKDDFRLGLSNYLKKYAYKNAETKDLWVELSNASKMDVNITEVMDTWTLQMGFPYVELERKGRTLTVTQ
ncbi:Leucyl-cystinyl aminopeptidase, partial [Stegodyphus mimosarum]